MGGLTDEERSALLDPPTSDPMDEQTFARLERRGLLEEVGCTGCGARGREPCAPGCEANVSETRLTTAGALALRLDAAARAIGGVR